MKNNILLILKGFVMGIANIIPGVSGGTLAIILGIYERFIGAISHFFSNFKENIKFLLPIIIGIALALVTMSSVIDYSYEHYPMPTSIFFVGLVIGGIPLLWNKTKNEKTKSKVANVVAFILTFGLVLFMALSDRIFGGSQEVVFSGLNAFGYLKVLGVGSIAAATMIIPGVSGSLVLMLLGYYYPIIKLIKEIVHFNDLFSNLIVAGVFGVGVLLGMVLISKLLEYLFAKHSKVTYCGVLGFIFASIISIPISSLELIKASFSVSHVIISIVTLIVGGIIAYKLGEK
ncbi:MAG: DUF368 domain-containing protein [Bacilli bacterium]|nr:DUF368 domain-containing protein [Bacilli bacterium]